MPNTVLSLPSTSCLRPSRLYNKENLTNLNKVYNINEFSHYQIPKFTNDTI
jgi:hypothetical protein